jgi:BirA family biotin operon repressor/biotin-[acetyl-CoA-carboxylase] ligase
VAIRVFDRLDSTNAAAWRLLNAGEINHGDTIVALEQSAGVGQRGRKWEDSGQDGLYTSIFLDGSRLNIQAHQLSLLNMAAAIAARQTIWRLFELLAPTQALPSFDNALQIKWPNDVYVKPIKSKGNEKNSFKKVCGVLVETSLQGNELSAAVIGIGINLTQTEWPPELPNAVSVFQALALSDESHAETLLHPKSVAQHLEAAWKETQTQLLQNPNAIHQRYNELLWRRGELCNFVVTRKDHQTRQLEGVIESVDVEGRLVVRLADGQQASFQHGEIAFADLMPVS